MFEALKEVLDRVIAQKKSSRVFVAAEVCAFSEKVFLAEIPELAPNFQVRFFQKGTLLLAVNNSAAAAEIKLAEIKILRAIQKRFPEVQKIRYRFEALEQQT